MDGESKVILFFGWYGHGNLGDEAFRLVFSKLCGNTTNYFCDYVPEGIKIDYCVLGGGDIVNEYNLKQLSVLDCPKIAMSVTITKNSISPYLDQIDHFYVRDTLSLKILKDSGYENSTFLPDVTFLLEPNKENGNLLLDRLFSDRERYGKIFGFIGNSHLIGDRRCNYNEKIKFLQYSNDMSQFMDDCPASFVFIPFSTLPPWDDRIFNGYVSSSMVFWKKSVVIWEPMGIQDIIDLISVLDHVFSMRYHASLFSLLGGTPSTTIASHDKFYSLANDFDMEYLDYWDTSCSNLKKLDLCKQKYKKIELTFLKERYEEIFRFEPR